MTYIIKCKGYDYISLKHTTKYKNYETIRTTSPVWVLDHYKL